MTETHDVSRASRSGVMPFRVRVRVRVRATVRFTRQQDGALLNTNYNTILGSCGTLIMERVRVRVKARDV